MAKGVTVGGIGKGKKGLREGGLRDGVAEGGR